MDSDSRGQPLSADTEDAERQTASSSLPSAVRGRLLALLREFTDATAMMEQVVAVLESVTSSPAEPSPTPFPNARNEARPSTDVTLEVSVDDPEGIDELRDALAEIPGVQRIRLSGAGEQSATFSVTLDASPTRTDSVIAFRDALAGLSGIRRVLLTEFVDDHATFVLSAGAAVLGAPALEAPSVVCAWCGRLLTIGSSLISHGICQTCAAGTAGASGTASPPPLPPTTDEVVYVQRGADVWLERRQGRDGAWVTSRSAYPADIPAQTILEGVSGEYPDRLVVLAGQAEAVAEPQAASTAGAGAATPAPLQAARQRRLSGRRPRVPADSSMARLRQTLRTAVPVDCELLLEELAGVQSVVDGLAHRKDLPVDAARDLNQSLDRLQETIDSINRLAVNSEATPRP